MTPGPSVSGQPTPLAVDLDAIRLRLDQLSQPVPQGAGALWQTRHDRDHAIGTARDLLAELARARSQLAEARERGDWLAKNVDEALVALGVRPPVPGDVPRAVAALIEHAAKIRAERDSLREERDRLVTEVRAFADSLDRGIALVDSTQAAQLSSIASRLRALAATAPQPAPAEPVSDSFNQPLTNAAAPVQPEERLVATGVTLDQRGKLTLTTVAAVAEDQLLAELARLRRVNGEWGQVMSTLIDGLAERGVPAKLGHRYTQTALDEIDRLRAALATAERRAEHSAKERDEAKAEIKRLEATNAAYWQAQKVLDEALDEALGEDEEDGAGEGLAADVALLAEQRDDERRRADIHVDLCKAQAEEISRREQTRLALLRRLDALDMRTSEAIRIANAKNRELRADLDTAKAERSAMAAKVRSAIGHRDDIPPGEDLIDALLRLLATAERERDEARRWAETLRVEVGNYATLRAEARRIADDCGVRAVQRAGTTNPSSRAAFVIYDKIATELRAALGSAPDTGSES